MKPIKPENLIASDGGKAALAGFGGTVTRPLDATIEHVANGQFRILMLVADGIEVFRDHGKLATLGIPSSTATSSLTKAQ